MPRTQIPVTTITRAGVAPPAQTSSDQASGMYIAQNNGRVFVEVENTDSGDQTVGFAIPGLLDGESVADKTITVAAGDTSLAGPFPAFTYNQPDHRLFVNPSVDTLLKLRAYKL